MSRSIVATDRARSSGCRKGSTATVVPILIRDVTADRNDSDARTSKKSSS